MFVRGIPLSALGSVFAPLRLAAAAQSGSSRSWATAALVAR
jgi:hypothetical protein